jgi:hypothetical protein
LVHLVVDVRHAAGGQPLGQLAPALQHPLLTSLPSAATWATSVSVMIPAGWPVWPSRTTIVVTAAMG